MRYYLLLFMLLNSACDVVRQESRIPVGAWLIPKAEIRDGGPGKDGIPALTLPDFTTMAAARDFLNDDDLVIMARMNGVVRVYPHRILDWHEIVNDRIGDSAFTVSYCPLTGSAIGFMRTLPVNGEEITTTFGVSGLLYNNNLILYDRATESYWSQMRNQCVSGPLIGQRPRNIPLVETTFRTAAELYPDAQVLSENTGVYSPGRYTQYPYGDYRTNNNTLLFDVNPDDTRLPRKERTFGVAVGNAARAYRFKDFSAGTQWLTDSIGDTSVLIIGDQKRGFFVAYRPVLDGAPAEGFTLVEDARYPEAVLQDSRGNLYDLFGGVTQGPDKGKQLKRVHGYIAYWFAWAAFHPQTDIFNP